MLTILPPFDRTNLIERQPLDTHTHTHTTRQRKEIGRQHIRYAPEMVDVLISGMRAISAYNACVCVAVCFYYIRMAYNIQIVVYFTFENVC